MDLPGWHMGNNLACKRAKPAYEQKTKESLASERGCLAAYPSHLTESGHELGKRGFIQGMTL
jgi:hypothetical protein